MRPLRVLLFEDGERDGERLVNALMERMPDLEVVWMKDAPNIVECESTYDGMSRRYLQPGEDIRFEGEHTPSEFDGGYWPEDFGGAVLDIEAPYGRPGDALASWLDQARFLGPVALVTLGAIGASIYPNLPWLRRFKKHGEWDWSQEIVEWMAGMSFRRTKAAGSVFTPSAGLKGRRPGLGAEVERYWRELDARSHNFSRMTSAWVGDDSRIQEHVTTLMGHAPAGDLFRTEEKGTGPIQESWAKPVMEAFKNGEDPLSDHRFRPDVIWVDCPGKLTENHIEQVDHFFTTLTKIAYGATEDNDEDNGVFRGTVDRRLQEAAGQWAPRVAILCDQVESVSEEDRARVLYHGTPILGRAEIFRPDSEWPALVVQQLISRWRAWYAFHEFRRETWEAGPSAVVREWGRVEAYETFLVEELFVALLTVLLFVPARAHLFTATRPTIPEWLAFSPSEASEVFNSTFEKCIGANKLPGAPDQPGWLRKLWLDGRISDLTWKSL